RKHHANSLFSMIDMKPPISRAKMMSVTKSAIKAIKLYKHVVQIVEKFIKKCKPELKVPGLYVVDSIVRQSRHQFGVDKDVFGPRFLKNFMDTFQNLYRCPEDDKSKIVRVLNLWQKNGVFDLDIIQPLMDMANGVIIPPPALEGREINIVGEVILSADPQPDLQPAITSASAVPAVTQLPSTDALAAVAQLFQSPHGQEVSNTLFYQDPDLDPGKRLWSLQIARNFSYIFRNAVLSLMVRFCFSNDFSVHVCLLVCFFRSPRRRRSRSSSRSRRSRHRRSRSRERRWRSRSQDRNERERDRERRQKGLPSMKSQTLSVCTTTLWVGQLDKKTQQSDVMSLLEEFGQIESINMIPPRGCAYIVMVHRQDANTALNKLSRGSYKVNQKPVKIAWALNKGIKSAHKKFWDVDRGVTYIPWSKVKVEELESYREGGMLDPETLNPDVLGREILFFSLQINMTFFTLSYGLKSVTPSLPHKNCFIVTK
uniref:Splicing factor, arginine/serine-rich 15-like n=1 Tax=Echeneis naucrates TaxID=173247 RepID=A0A665V028_ECHNA